MTHVNSNTNSTAFLTRFLPKWAWFWLSPVIFALLLRTIGVIMPWENIYLFPIQSLFLTIPIWLLGFWWVWGLGCVLVWRKRLWLLPIPLLGIGYPIASVQSGSEVLLVANVNAFSGRQQFLQSYLEMFHPDYAILIEKRADEIKGMKRAADDFATPVGRPSHHIAVFCRAACQAWVSPQIGSREMKMSYALLRIDSGLCVVGIHAPPPVPVVSTGMRPYVDEITKYIEQGKVKADWKICKKGDPVLVVGDMNAVSGSWAHQKFMDTGLLDQQAWVGPKGATWPASSKGFIDFPFFRIDHVLSSLPTSGVQRIDIPDSDHRGLLIGLPDPEKGSANE